MTGLMGGDGGLYLQHCFAGLTNIPTDWEKRYNLDVIHVLTNQIALSAYLYQASPYLDAETLVRVI